jgi:hypothetical protein
LKGFLISSFGGLSESFTLEQPWLRTHGSISHFFESRLKVSSKKYFQKNGANYSRADRIRIGSMAPLVLKMMVVAKLDLSRSDDKFYWLEYLGKIPKI